MPIIEYECLKCGNAEEIVKKIDDESPEICPKCGDKMARRISSTNFNLKGYGWPGKDIKEGA